MRFPVARLKNEISAMLNNTRSRIAVNKSKNVEMNQGNYINTLTLDLGYKNYENLITEVVSLYKFVNSVTRGWQLIVTIHLRLFFKN